MGSVTWRMIGITRSWLETNFPRVRHFSFLQRLPCTKTLYSVFAMQGDGVCTQNFRLSEPNKARCG
jgi:hypothetical protein